MGPGLADMLQRVRIHFADRRPADVKQHAREWTRSQ